MPLDRRTPFGVSPHIVRLSVGIEPVASQRRLALARHSRNISAVL